MPVVVLIIRTRLLTSSATYILPVTADQQTSAGLLNSAAVAAIPSPLYPAVPLPAMVEITPAAFLLRIRLL